MRTSRRMLKQVRRALVATFLFSGCVNLLMLATPLYTLQIFETVVPLGSLETLVFLSVMAAGAMLALSAVEIARDNILLRAALWLDHELGQHILDNGVKLGIAGSELKQDAAALERLKSFLASNAILPLFDAPWTPIFLVALFALHPLIGGIAVASVLLLIAASLVQSALTARLEGERARSLERSQHWWATIAGNAQFAGALGLGQGAASAWEQTNRAQVSAAYSIGKRSSFVRSLSRLVRIGSQVAVYGIGAWLVVKSEIAPGALVAAAILLARALAPLENLVSSIRGLQGAVAGYRRLKALPADAVTPRIAASGAPVTGRIELKDATFYYPGRKTPALRGVSMSLSPGRCTGIVGSNGSGKSTLVAMLAGAIVPGNGSADLDGVPIAKWQRMGAETPIGYLPDEPILIEGSVHENIARFGEASLMAVANAAVRAGVLDILQALPQGFDTSVGPQGAGLALRERRAVAFARALFGSSKFVALDEPELGLDGAGLRRLQATIGDLKAAGTTLIIATQDPRLLQLCDDVAVMNQGALQVFGPADEVKQRIDAERRRSAEQLHAVH